VTNEFVRRKARISGFDGPPGKPVFGNIPDIKYNAAEKVVMPKHGVCSY
jgi:3-hydroxyphenylacetate 6-hydroxylase